MAGFSYRGAGKVRRRLRRRIRSRPFTNARTATRSLDLLLAIGDPHVCPSGPIFVYRSIPASVIAATAAGFLCHGAGRAAVHPSCVTGDKRASASLLVFYAGG
jgi:hypothetical protein